MFKPLFATLVLALSALAPSLSAAQGIPVVDAQNIAQQIANHAETITKYVEQIAVLRDQLVSAKAQLESLTGSRNLGDILNNPAIRNSLPPDIQQVWRDLDNTSSRLTSAIDNVMTGERSRLTGDWSVDREAVTTRLDRIAATTKVLTGQAYEGQQKRLQQIDQLQQQINLTRDPKAIAELQARIQVEQANITADQTRTSLMLEQLKAERELAEQQANQLVDQLFSPSTIRPMPR
jgi:type IV secretion system protein VirB5